MTLFYSLILLSIVTCCLSTSLTSFGHPFFNNLVFLYEFVMAFLGIGNSVTSGNFLLSVPATLKAWFLRVGDAVATVVDSPKMSLRSLLVVPGFFEYGMLERERRSNYV